MSKKDKEEKEIKDAAKTAEAENDGMKNESAGDNAGEADTDKVTETPETADDIDADSSEDDKKDNAKNESSKKDPKDVMIADLQDRVKRQMAEFDNFRKRTEKEKSAMFEMGASDIIKKLLPIVDNFERGFKSVSDEEKETPFAKGMDMVYKQTLKMLEDAGVKPIEALGQEFNPDMHNAVMHVEDDSVGDNIIVEEFEKGYIYRETVIRHSMVKVAN
ncbi:MAG: nucleotide exchange factor GrpE [Lachnospira sp.]|nr:nucleotide exchange factor GrpE [Lachnospira sp.]MDD5828243.1 nucleotide exchange factor GrpE [Lachnospira sp.]